MIILDENTHFQEARTNMVQNQIIPCNVWDKHVIAALSAVPKHMFVNKKFENVAYSESNLFLEQERSMLSPITFAKMLQAAKIKKSDIILDIGCGSGYSSAVLSILGHHIIGLENLENLTKQANYLINQLGIKNCSIKFESMLQPPMTDEKLYDIVFINGILSQGITHLLKALSRKGRLITVEYNKNGVPAATIYTKKDHEFVKSEICYTNNIYLN